jgi:hypothetical protein
MQTKELSMEVHSSKDRTRRARNPVPRIQRALKLRDLALPFLRKYGQVRVISPLPIVWATCGDYQFCLYKTDRFVLDVVYGRMGKVMSLAWDDEEWAKIISFRSGDWENGFERSLALHRGAQRKLH